MENVLIRIKKLLNSIDDEELKEMNLWIDNDETIDAVMLETYSITLITNTEKLIINDKEW